MAKIALIVGSVRHDRQGIKVARWMEQKLKDRNHTVFFIDPSQPYRHHFPYQEYMRFSMKMGN